MTSAASSSSCYTCSCMLATGIMQPPCLLLLFLLLPEMLADREGKWILPSSPPSIPIPALQDSTETAEGGYRQDTALTIKGQLPIPQYPNVQHPCSHAQGYLPHTILSSPALQVLVFRCLNSQEAKGPYRHPGVSPKTLFSCRVPVGCRGSQPLTALYPRAVCPAGTHRSEAGFTLP